MASEVLTGTSWVLSGHATMASLRKGAYDDTPSMAHGSRSSASCTASALPVEPCRTSWVEGVKEVNDGLWGGVLAATWPASRGDVSVQRLDACRGNCLH